MLIVVEQRVMKNGPIVGRFSTMAVMIVPLNMLGSFSQRCSPWG